MSTISIPITLDQTTISITVGYGLSLGESSATAYYGDKGKTAYDHSQEEGNAHGASLSDFENDAGFIDNATDTFISEAIVQHIVTLTQAEYDAIEAKDSNTLYIIPTA